MRLSMVFVVVVVICFLTLKCFNSWRELLEVYD